MTKEEVKSQLIEKYQALKAILENNNLEAEVVFKANQLIIWKKMSRLLGAAAAPDDIKLPTFESALKEWRDTLKKGFQELKSAYSEVVIDVAKFRQYLKDEIYVIPFNKKLQEEWLAVINGWEGTTTGAILFEALIKNNGEYWNILENTNKIAEHYNKRKNKKFYKDLEVTEERMATTKLPQKAFFLDAIAASTDPTDPALPENKASAEEDLAAREVLYKAKLKSWFDLESNQLDSLKPDTLHSNISCSCLNVTSTEVTFNIISKESKEGLLQAIKGRCVKEAGASDVVVWHDAASYAKSALSDYYNQLISDQDWQNYPLKSIEVIGFPINIGRWMMNCDTVSINNKKQFSVKVKFAFENLLKLALSYTKKYGPNFKFNVDELILKMKNEFKIADQIDLDSLIDLDSIYKNVDNRIITTQEFYNKLKIAIDARVTDNSIDNFYNIVINQNLSSSVTIEALLQQLVNINTEIETELTLVLNKQKESGKKPVRGVIKELSFYGLSANITSDVNWNAILNLGLSVQKRENNFKVYIKSPSLIDIVGTKIENPKPRFEINTALTIDKSGTWTNIPINLAFGFDYTQGKVPVQLIKDSQIETIVRNLIGAELRGPTGKLYSELELTRVIKQAVPISGTVGTPIKIIMVSYYTFKLEGRYNKDTKSLDFRLTSFNVCDNSGKFKVRTAISEESFTADSDIQSLKV